jgi:hypothetical protein
MIMNAVAIPVLPAVRLKNILYTTDFSKPSRAALPVVAAIARKYGSRIFAAHVWAPLPYSMVTPEALSVLEDKEESDARTCSSNSCKPRNLKVCRSPQF